MRIYYAHCLSIYNTPQERRDVATLMRLGFTVVNPNDPDLQQQVERHKQAGRSDLAMELVFKPVVCNCDALVFRALPDGNIPAGVAKEIAWTLQEAKPIIELPRGLERRALSVDRTREYLHKVGQR